MRNKIRSAKKAAIFLLIAIASLAVISNNVYAIWHELLYENFERDANTWPWSANGHLWIVDPNPLQVQIPDHTWGVEDSAVFYDDHPEIPYYRAAWCSGVPNDLLPGIQAYYVNNNPVPGDWMIWGPMNFTTAVAAEANFWLWADVENNALGTGDDFYVLAYSGNPTSRNINTWRRMFELHATGDGCGTGWQWVHFSTNFDSTWNQNHVYESFLGRNNCYIAFHFWEDQDHHGIYRNTPTQQSGLGVFIDNIACGWDDGYYDFYGPNIYPVCYYNGSFHEFNDIHVDNEVGFHCNFVFAGPDEILNEDSTTNALYINDVLIDTVRDVYLNGRYGNPYQVVLGYPWIPTEEGEYTARFVVDIHNEVAEHNAENNNTTTVTFTVGERTTQPIIEFIAPGQDPLYENQLVNIQYIITNYPPDEPCYLSLYYDTNPVGFNGQLIPGARDIVATHGVQATHPWNIAGLPNGAYYIYAEMNDYYFPIALEYAPSPVVKGNMPSLNLPLAGRYFELISTYLVPPQLNAVQVFGNINHLTIVYQDDGDIFIPNQLNTIGDITVTKGYQIYCSAASTLTIQGLFLYPDAEYSVEGGRWNWIGYPYNFSVPVDYALGSIYEAVEIICADDGTFWIPGLLNSLGNMTPGEGYYVFANSDASFQYDFYRSIAASEEEVLTIPECVGAPKPTGLPYTILFEFTQSVLDQHPVSVEVFDDNLLVGKAIVLDQSISRITPVTAWEGSTEHNLPGFVKGHPITVRVKDSHGLYLNTYPIDGSLMAGFGEGAYASITLDAEGVDACPSTFMLGNAYPNPFNPTVTIPFSIPENGEVVFAVYNILGQQVFQSVQSLQAGNHDFIFDASRATQELVSGLYLVQLHYKGETLGQKVMLLQ